MKYTIKKGQLVEALESDKVIWEHITDNVSPDIYFSKLNNCTSLKCEMFCRDSVDTTPVRIQYSDTHLLTFSGQPLLSVDELTKNSEQHPTSLHDHISILIELLAIDIEHSISLLSDVHRSLDILGERILKMNSDQIAKEVLDELHKQEEINSRIRENSIDTHRVVSFLQKTRVLNPEQIEYARLILHDVESCDTNTAFVFDKVNFLMSNIVSIVNINQSRIIKIFSVVNVALMPPTLVASIYGQNIFFPEITWLDEKHLAYPWTVFLMLLSAIIPMWLFAKKGWLK